MKEKLKDKKVIGTLVIGVVAIITIIVFIVMSMNSSDLKLKNKKVAVEYGQKISLEAKDYLDDVDQKIIDQTNVTIKEDVAIDEKQYLDLGEYTVVLSYKKDTAEVKVVIKDTVAPSFKDFKDTVETAKDVIFDYTKLYTAEDLTQVTMTCDDKDVKYDTVGEYKATVKATDTSKNETSKEITVKVIEPSIKLEKESASLYVKETVILKVTIVGKDEKATFKSSDDKVASVDQDGKVTAKAAGTATITATANGKEATSKITVKKVPTGSSTTTKKDNNGNTVTVVTPPSSSGGSSSGGSTPASASTSREAFNLQNKKRATAGVNALEWDNELAEIAMKRAKEISVNFTHKKTYRADGRLVNAENAGKDYASASLVVDGWYNSSGHRKAMLRDTYTKCAIARYGDYWVALFTK